MVTPIVIQRQSGDATQEGLKKFYRDNAISRLEVVKRTHPKYIFSPKNRVHAVTVIIDICSVQQKIYNIVKQQNVRQSLVALFYIIFKYNYLACSP